MSPDHVVTIRARTVLMVAAVLLGVVVLFWVVRRSEQVLVWTLVSLLLAMALNPAPTPSSASAGRLAPSSLR